MCWYGGLTRPVKTPPAGLPGHLLKNLFAVRVRFLRISSGSATMTAHPWVAAETAAEMLFVLEQDRVNNRVCALCCLDGVSERFFAAVVNAVGENHHGLAAGLFRHQLVGVHEH